MQTSCYSFVVVVVIHWRRISFCSVHVVCSSCHGCRNFFCRNVLWIRNFKDCNSPRNIKDTNFFWCNTIRVLKYREYYLKLYQILRKLTKYIRNMDRTWLSIQLTAIFVGVECCLAMFLSVFFILSFIS